MQCPFSLKNVLSFLGYYSLEIHLNSLSVIFDYILMNEDQITSGEVLTGDGGDGVRVEMILQNVNRLESYFLHMKQMVLTPICSE